MEAKVAGVEDAFINDHDVDPVRLWVYGHTHQSDHLIVNSTRVVSAINLDVVMQIQDFDLT
jgi:hypothetical protein